MIDARADRLHERLATELGELGVEDLPAAVLDELAQALQRHTHEGHLPGYGAIVLDAERAARTGATAGRTEFEDVERLRQLADGRTSFVERVDDQLSLWFAGGEVTEVDLVTMCRQRGGHAVRLDPDGDLHLFGTSRVLTRRRAHWHDRPTAASLHAELADRATCPGEEAVLEGLLDLAAHVLSPHDVGATLAWLPDWERTGCVASLPAGGSTPLLSLCDRTLDGAVTNLLRQHDGAALVSPEGALWWVGAELTGPALPDDDPADGGMRHRSAARFSRLRPEAWVIVVSQDGPVSVFVGGHDVTAAA